ncbi:unnamed protein product, partial [Aureobasidium pullulans]
MVQLLNKRVRPTGVHSSDAALAIIDKGTNHTSCSLKKVFGKKSDPELQVDFAAEGEERIKAGLQNLYKMNCPNALPPTALFECRHAAFPWGELLINPCNGEKIDTGLENFLVSVHSSIDSNNSQDMEAAIYDRSGSRAAPFHLAKGRPVYVDHPPMFCPRIATCRRYTDEEYPALTQCANAELGHVSLVFSFPNISAPSIILFIYKSTRLAGSPPLLQKDDIGPFRTMELQKTLQRGVQVMSPIMNMTLRLLDLTLEKWRTSTTTAKETPSTTFSTARYLRISSSQPGTISPLVNPRLSPSMKTLL